MDEQTLNMLAAFLKRVPLKGEEVPAFNAVLAAVQKLAALSNTAPSVHEEDVPVD